MNCPDIIADEERIVRFIYSEKNINPRNNSLRLNFVQFRANENTGKNELSCTRFDFDTIENCRLLGKYYSDPAHDRQYFGLACIKAASIRKHKNYELHYAPQLETHPKHIFHCDIYDNSIPLIQDGVALPPEATSEREIFKKRWVSYKDTGGEEFIKEKIQPLE